MSLSPEGSAYSSVAYGLGICSAIRLPELPSGGMAADIVIRFGKAERLPSELAGAERSFQITPEGVHLLWKEVGTLIVREGREIIIDPAPSVEEPMLRLFILGPALAVLLHQRGLLVLHASSVTAHGAAVAFVGEPGSGKSTLAAAFHAAGHGVLADDVTAVQFDQDVPLVLPGVSQLKLWPDIVRALGEDPQALPRLHPSVEKRAYRIVSGSPPTPLPLHRVFVLAEGVVRLIEPLRAPEALVELLRHSYCARLLQIQQAATHFFQCANLISSVPIRRLKTPRSLAALRDLVWFIEGELARTV